MPQVQWATQAYQARSPQLLSQQAINCFTEPTPKEGKTTTALYGIPGLTLFSRMGNGPILGLHVMNVNLYILSGPELWTIPYSTILATAPGSPIAAEFIGTTSLGGLASMADNTRQLVMVDGSARWIYQLGGLNQVTTTTETAGATSIPANITGTITSGDTLLLEMDDGSLFTTTAAGTVDSFDTAIPLNNALPSQLSAGGIIIDPANQLGPINPTSAFQAASTVRYFDGYFVFNATGTRQFFLSGINDGTQYSGLDFATASAGSDMLVSVEIWHEQLILLCERHSEVWWDAGNVAFPFQRYDAALIARGIPSNAPYAVCSEDNTYFWMGDDGIFYRLDNYAPKRISTFAMETAWAKYPLRFTDASCFVLDQEGHKFIIVNFPSGNATWVYDISSDLWHQRISYGTAWV
jgi:hypothetical protein